MLDYSSKCYSRPYVQVPIYSCDINCFYVCSAFWWPYRHYGVVYGMVWRMVCIYCMRPFMYASTFSRCVSWADLLVSDYLHHSHHCIQTVQTDRQYSTGAPEHIIDVAVNSASPFVTMNRIDSQIALTLIRPTQHTRESLRTYWLERSDALLTLTSILLHCWLQPGKCVATSHFTVFILGLLNLILYHSLS